MTASVFLPTGFFASLRWLRAVVWFDAFTGVLLGVLHLALTAQLSQWLGLSSALLQVSGAMLLGYAALAGAIAGATTLPRRPLAWLAAGNLAWSLASLALLVTGWGAPTLLGQAYLLVHVASVALLAALQWQGLRQMPARSAGVA